MTTNNLATKLAERYQVEKDNIALLRREGLEWHEAFPVSIRQTLFPSIFQKINENEKPE
ncbi:hypothetical protein [Bacillus suaedae]|uniref:Uncharacterized protein n=1 Tax=Halalkalibacter suaedae TaxID=2822140 RepID=A0A940WQS8_9BACI|nr:hypothetical protein [Bacillus suaedae]MBP3950626.1 hypothetical protein [Bacillus suaedae]